MKSGDYMIHVSDQHTLLILTQIFIEQAKQLKVPEGATVDPIIQIDVLNEKKFTTAKDDIGASSLINWNEHIFFEPKNVVSYLCR